MFIKITHILLHKPPDIVSAPNLLSQTAQELWCMVCSEKNQHQHLQDCELHLINRWVQPSLYMCVNKPRLHVTLSRCLPPFSLGPLLQTVNSPQRESDLKMLTQNLNPQKPRKGGHNGMTDLYIERIWTYMDNSLICANINSAPPQHIHLYLGCWSSYISTERIWKQQVHILANLKKKQQATNPFHFKRTLSNPDNRPDVKLWKAS